MIRVTNEWFKKKYLYSSKATLYDYSWGYGSLYYHKNTRYVIHGLFDSDKMVGIKTKDFIGLWRTSALDIFVALVILFSVSPNDLFLIGGL